MSYTKDVTIWCDKPGCGKWVGQAGYHTVAAARGEAVRAGWGYFLGRDFCSEHAPGAVRASQPVANKKEERDG